MTGSRNALLPQADYQAIEAAVMETARGRWFLAEYARRHRAADTAAVLEAIARLEAMLTAAREPEAAIVPARDKAVGLDDPPSAPGEAPDTSDNAPATPGDAPATPVDLDLIELAKHLLRGDPAADWADWQTLAAEDAVDEEHAKKDTGDADFAADDDSAADESWPPVPEKSAAVEPESLITPAPAPAPPVAASPVPETFRTVREPTPLDTVSPALEAKPLTPGRDETPPRTEPASAPELTKPVEPAAAPRPIVRPLPPVRRTVLPKKPDPERYRQGPRIDDPTLTMTRDEKLALFS